MIELTFDRRVGRSDIVASEHARADIRHRLIKEVCRFRFGSVLYLNEFRIAQREGRIGEPVIVIVGSKRIDMVNGKLDEWPGELCVWDNQLDRLI